MDTHQHSLAENLGKTEYALVERIKSAVLSIEPTATLALYGSRARGDARSDSDWDILVLLDGTISHSRKVALWNALYLLELDTRESIGATIKSRTEWAENSILHATAFYQNLEQEAIRY